jgi:translocation and assembly module TamB
LADLRHAFELDDWPVEGVMTLSGLALQGKYREMFGGGEMQIDRGTAWGEGFDRTTGSLLLEGSGLRVNRIEMTKGDGLIRGAARLGWDGTYAFNADGRVAVEALDNFRVENTPLSGMLSFRATGAAEFDSPTYTVAGVVPDLYIGDQGIGAIEGQIRINNGRLLIERMAVRSGLMDVDARGTVDLNDALDGDLHFRFTETSVDPYLKFVLPELSPYTRAILSGSVDVAGPLRQPRRLDIQGDVHDATLVLFDYQLKNDGPIQLSYANEAMAIRNLKLRGSDTNLAVTGGFDGRQRRWDLAAGGDASLAILQLFFPAINASGAATLDARLAGSFDQPVISGNATIADGRLRPLASPHSLEGINGRISFGAREINVDDLSGRIGSGLVDFGGTINLDGYRLAEYNLTASGRSMRLRYPQGFNSTVNMDLLLTGPIATPILTGSIDVLRVGLVAQAQTETGLLGLVAGGASATDLAPAEPVSGEGIPLALDIQVSVPRTAFIDTRTAHVEGTADLRVRGTFDRPVLTGALELVSGEWLFNGNRYFVREGTIDFGSSGSLEPVFDVAAETRPRAAGQTFDVQIRITGPLDRLSPTLTSDPWLPETEIISLLLGGTPSLRTVEQRALRSPQELQERMVQTAGAVLLTSPISSRVGAVVERFSTIDTVQITPLLSQDASFQQLNPSARITLGKRISSRVFLTYSRTLSASQEEIILIEYDQSDRMSWVLSRNQDRTFALDFRIRYVF